VLLSDRWRGELRAEGARREEVEPGVERIRGDAVLRLRRLRVEAREITIRWLADYEDLLVYAEEVETFRQVRGGRPYGTENVSVVSLANDKVSFLH
jgi:hypothetical protein